jgi:hypothetical protein
MKESKWSATHIRALSLLLLIGALSNGSHAAPGDVDLSFDPGSGVNGTVQAFAVQPDGKLIIVGQFNMVKGLLRYGIARLNADGSGDASFDAHASGGTALDCVALQPDGKVLIGGDFLTVNGVLRTYVARLHGILFHLRPPSQIGRRASVSLALPPPPRMRIQNTTGWRTPRNTSWRKSHPAFHLGASDGQPHRR